MNARTLGYELVKMKGFLYFDTKVIILQIRLPDMAEGKNWDSLNTLHNMNHCLLKIFGPMSTALRVAVVCSTTWATGIDIEIQRI